MNREEARRYMIHWQQELKDGGFAIDSDRVQALRVAIEALSAEPTSDDLIIKGAKRIKDGLYNIKDGKLFQYKAKGGTVRPYKIVDRGDTE